MNNQPITVEINVRISQQPFGAGNIVLTETLQLPETDFLGFAAIMKRFHDLAHEIGDQKRKV